MGFMAAPRVREAFAVVRLVFAFDGAVLPVARLRLLAAFRGVLGRPRPGLVALDRGLVAVMGLVMAGSS